MIDAYAGEVADLVNEHGFNKAHAILRQRKIDAAKKPEPTMGDAFEGTQEEWDRWLAEWKWSNWR
jgi:hypothetical protein